MEKYYWLLFAALAGLCWGTYVPFVQAGLSPDGFARNAFASFLCVGVAYFLIAIIVPAGVLSTGEGPMSWAGTRWNAYGISFATLAGVAGALGALCVIYANRNASADDRFYIASIIFGTAPILNTLISTVWHPSRENPFHFGVEHLPGWKLIAGIVFIGIGAALVLYSKEEAEGQKGRPMPAATKIEQPAVETPSQP